MPVSLASKLKQIFTSENRDNLQHIHSSLGFCHTHVPGLASEDTQNCSNEVERPLQKYGPLYFVFSGLHYNLTVSIQHDVHLDWDIVQSHWTRHTAVGHASSNKALRVALSE